MTYRIFVHTRDSTAYKNICDLTPEEIKEIAEKLLDKAAASIGYEKSSV